MFTLEELFDLSDCVSYTLCSSFVTCDEEEEKLLKLFNKIQEEKIKKGCVKK